MIKLYSSLSFLTPFSNLGKCVNEFAKPKFAESLDWENIPFKQLGSSRYGFTPEGCTQEAVEKYGTYSCAVATVDVGFIPCDGDCQNGKCVDGKSNFQNDLRNHYIFFPLFDNSFKFLYFQICRANYNLQKKYLWRWQLLVSAIWWRGNLE